MRVYFLVEGVTERKLYPAWMAHLAPSLTRISDPNDPCRNGYYLISGGGYPGLLDNHLENSLADICDAGNYDYFVIVLDSDELSTQEVIALVNDRLRKTNSALRHCRVQIIVQNRCVETWLLGNRRIFRRNPTNQDFLGCVPFYDVLNQDPEMMGKPINFSGTTSQYHLGYLKCMLKERNIKYSKTNPGQVTTGQYLDQLLERITDLPDQLPTLQVFFTLCETFNRYGYL